jgi:hypothetical protein
MVQPQFHAKHAWGYAAFLLLHQKATPAGLAHGGRFEFLSGAIAPRAQAM